MILVNIQYILIQYKQKAQTKKCYAFILVVLNIEHVTFWLVINFPLSFPIYFYTRYSIHNVQCFMLRIQDSSFETRVEFLIMLSLHYIIYSDFIHSSMITDHSQFSILQSPFSSVDHRLRLSNDLQKTTHFCKLRAENRELRIEKRESRIENRGYTHEPKSK